MMLFIKKIITLNHDILILLQTFMIKLRLTVAVGMPEFSEATLRPLASVVTCVSGLLMLAAGEAWAERHRLHATRLLTGV